MIVDIGILAELLKSINVEHGADGDPSWPPRSSKSAKTGKTQRIV